MSGQLTDEEIAALMPSELVQHQTPIPTQIVSSDEFYPDPQNERQREVEARLLAMADDLGGKQGLDRRRFFQSAAGMAASFVAMNEVYGPLFEVSKAEAATPAMAQERATALKDQFIMDMHTHFLRDDTRIMTFVNMRAAVGKAGWNKSLTEKEQTIEDLKFENYKKEMFLDSDTKMSLDLVGAFRRSGRLVPDQRDGGSGARQGEQGGRLAAHVRACDLHARPTQLAGEPGKGSGAGQAELDQGLHDRRQHPQEYQPLPLAHGRREGRLQGLRAGAQIRHQERLRAQGIVRPGG